VGSSLKVMKKEFIPYEQALALKELGFDEESLGRYNGEGYLYNTLAPYKYIIIPSTGIQSIKNYCLAPLYQQAFRWFREKYGLYGYPFSQSSQTNIWFKYFIQQEWKDQITSDSFNTHEEAELECLKKLIEIIKEKFAQVKN
jgi:hypothetical protein